MTELASQQIETDQCVFIKDDVTTLIYGEDCIIISKNDNRIAEIIDKLRKRYTIVDEGKMEEYLSIQLEYTSDSIITSQPLFIERIIDSVPGTRKTNPVNYPTLPSVILTKIEQGPERVDKWNYRSVIRILSFLTNYSHH